jgi:hypothetical protein
MAVKLTEASLYVHKRLRKMGGWRTAAELRDDVVHRTKGRAMLMQMGPMYGGRFAYVPGEDVGRWEYVQRERVVARISSRLVQLRRGTPAIAGTALFVRDGRRVVGNLLDLIAGPRDRETPELCGHGAHLDVDRGGRARTVFAVQFGFVDDDGAERRPVAVERAPLQAEAFEQFLVTVVGVGTAGSVEKTV